MNKKTLTLIFVFVMIALSAVSAFAQDITVPETFEGVWVCGRAEIRMIRADMGYKAVITWASSYAENNAWEYTLLYDAQTDSIIDEGTGVMSTTVFDENGNETSYTENYTDGTARFRLNEAGKLLWEDAKEDAGKGMEFEKVAFDNVFPTQEDFAGHYFRMIGAVPRGIAGASLRQAKAAYDAYTFAWQHMIWNEDVPTLRSDMLSAWESLSDEERSAFDRNFIDIVRLIDRCLDDWEAYQGPFVDAGVPVDIMGEMLKDTAAQVSWADLVGHTLTMGNSDGI